MCILCANCGRYHFFHIKSDNYSILYVFVQSTLNIVLMWYHSCAIVYKLATDLCRAIMCKFPNEKIVSIIKINVQEI